LKKVFSLFFIFLFGILTLSQTFYNEQDKEICKSKFNYAVGSKLADKPINIIITEIGKSFIGTDYQAHTLEKEGDERLVIDLTGFDCTTFLENVLAFARCIKSEKFNFEDFQNELIMIRYRNGVIDHYPSRLHYFSDWIYDNSKKGIIEDITKKIGGIIYPGKVGFMTANKKEYKQISENEIYYNQIREQEQKINKRAYYYIPKNQVRKIENKIQSGYLIAITTNIHGLDISHTGIAIKKDNGRIYLLHASSSGTKVQISEKPLSKYLAGNKSQTGIIVLKPLEPTNPKN
jgi:hypothetical protein